MKVQNVIDSADRKMPGNSYSQEEKIKWLKALELIWKNFLEGYGYKAEVSAELTEESELSIGEPFDEVYVMWLVMKMHYYNGEIELYNNSAASFENELLNAKQAFVRNNRSKNNHSFSGFKEV